MRGLIFTVVSALCLGACTPPPGSPDAPAWYNQEMINRPGLYGGGG